MSSNLDGAPDEVLERLYTGAITAAEGGRLEEAVEMLDQVMELNPNFHDAWWNMGTCRAMLNQHGPALSAWDLYRCMVPDDWRARPKVIQSCQALGDTARRDRERDELLALRRAGTDPELAAEPRYCLEQFRVGDLAVFAYEIFEPAGKMAVFYQFIVGQPRGMILGEYSLGSYDFTTNSAREAGRLGPDERYYHLDRYDPAGHTTFGFYTTLPSYDEVRAGVVAAITGAITPWSGSSISPDGTQNIDLYGPQEIHLSGPDPRTLISVEKTTPAKWVRAWLRRAVRRDDQPN